MIDCSKLSDMASKFTYISNIKWMNSTRILESAIFYPFVQYVWFKVYKDVIMGTTTFACEYLCA